MVCTSITKKMVLGTAQFGMDYGITNNSGKPSENEILKILDLAWDKGVRNFDTAPVYGAEKVLGNYFLLNGLQDKVNIMTKIPNLGKLVDYKKKIINSRRGEKFRFQGFY